MKNIIELKKIISIFIKVNTDDITDDSIIDTTVIQGSVLFHRMISRVNKLYSIELDDYSSIKTFSNLIKAIEEKIQ